MPALIPYLAVADAAAAIDFYARVFGATETIRMTGEDGRIGHAELDLAGSRVMLSDEHPEIGVHGPAHYGGTPVSLVVQVPDVDEVFARAVAAGATVERPVADQFHGERSGWFADPWGHRWNVGTPTEDVTADQLRDRVADRYTVT
jgi:PhnB protein